MDSSQSILTYEENRLEETIDIAKKQLEEAKKQNENNKEAILEAKKEMRENTQHSIANLWGSDAFEALAAMSQYANPITDKIADYEEVEQKKLILEKMIESPYFARIDFRFDGEDEFEQIYIGRSSLMKDKKFDMYVYDWRSPIASIFYRFVMGEAYYDAPGGRITGEINLKRQFEINNSRLEYFFDADVQIVDEFLRKLLSKNTSPKMKTIIETIQKEQDIVIRDMETQLMMVQGVAGSGKTSIALHRAAYLMYQGLSDKLSADNIIIISPNTLFEQYIANVLPELGESNIESVVFEEIASSILHKKNIQSRNHFLENLISSSGYQDIMKHSMEFKMSGAFQAILDRFIDDIAENQIRFEDVWYKDRCIMPKEVLKKKILSGMNDTPLGQRLKLMEDYIIELIREFKGKSIRQEEELEIRDGLRKFTKLRIIKLYKKLIRDKKYFFRMAKGTELPDGIDDILKFTQENMESSYLYYDDAAVLTYLRLKIYGTKKYRNMKQVVIDEAQDYYPLHFEIFNLLFPRSKFTILGDINQTLEKGEDLTLYEKIGSIFHKKSSSLVTLDKSFRCTNEILKFGLKFLEGASEIKSFNREGVEPQVYSAEDQEMLEEQIISEVNVCKESGYESVGLICKTEKSARTMYECLKDKMNVHLVNNDGSDDVQGIFIIPVYMSKGLEFDAVLICDADAQSYQSEDDKKLLYIACTRALHRLNLFCKGEKSSLLL